MACTYRTSVPPSVVGRRRRAARAPRPPRSRPMAVCTPPPGTSSSRRPTGHDHVSAPAAQRDRAGRHEREHEHPGGTDAGVVELEAIGRVGAGRSGRGAGMSTAFEPSRRSTTSPAAAAGAPTVAPMTTATTAARADLGVLITGSFRECSAPKLRRSRRLRKSANAYTLGVSEQAPGELGARVDADLAVDARELRPDRLRRHEQGGRDLLVGASLGGERRDAALGLASARPSPRGRPPTRASSARAFSAQSRAPSCSKIGERVLERLARRPLHPGPPPRRAEREQRAGLLERHRHAIVLGERLLAAARAHRRGRRARPRADRGSDLPRRARTPGRAAVAWRSRTIEQSLRPPPAGRARSAPRSRRARSAPNRALGRRPLRGGRRAGRAAGATASNRSSESSSRPSAQAPRMVANMTPCSGASASVVSASARAPSTSPRAARTSPRTPSADEALRLLVGLQRRSRCPPARSRLGLVPAPREELGPAELGEDPRQRALLGTLLGSPAKGAEELARLRELVDPGQHDAEREGRADGGLNGPRSLLELPATLERLPPFAPARHRVDQAELAEGGDLHARSPACRARVTAARAWSAAADRSVRSRKSDAGEALLDARPEHDVVARVGQRASRYSSTAWRRSPSYSSKRPEPVEDLAAPRASAARWISSLAQQLPGPLRLARLPGEDRRRPPCAGGGSPPSPPASAGGPAPTARRRRGTHRGRAPARAARSSAAATSASGPSAAEREMAGALLRVGKKLRQAAVERAALVAAGLGVHAGGEQRMGEADAVPVQLDRRAPRRPARAARRLRRRRRAPPARASGCDTADAASSATRVSRGSSISRSRTTDASVPGSGSPASSRIAPRLTARPSSSANSGFPPDSSRSRRSFGPRQDEVEPVAQQPVKRAEAERADTKPPQPLLGQRAIEVERGGRAFVLPQRQQKRDRVLAQTAQRELEHEGGRPVEPLEVVDRDDDGLGPREHSQRSDERRARWPADPVATPPPRRRGAPRRAPWPAGSGAPAARPASASPRRSPSATNESCASELDPRHDSTR